MMTPDQIHDYIVKHYKQLVPSRLRKRDGWSFYLGKVFAGPMSTRIFHAVTFQNRTGPATKIKLSVSSRMGPEQMFVFHGDEKALKQYIDQELKLWQKHFANKTY